MTGPEGLTVGAGCPLRGVTVTWKSTPAWAEVMAAACFELMVTFVRRPTTAEGVTTKTFPLPLDVFMAVLMVVTAPAIPPVSAPVDEFTTHWSGLLGVVEAPAALGQSLGCNQDCDCEYTCYDVHLVDGGRYYFPHCLSPL